MLVDANVLVYAVDENSPHHAPAQQWLTDALRGVRRVALPWQSIGAFLRITTHPRITPRPLSPVDAWSHVADWLDQPVCWIPPSSRATAVVLAELVRTHRVTGNLVPDAQLAAVAIEHGIPVVSADSDFARFPEVRWINPLEASAQS